MSAAGWAWVVFALNVVLFVAGFDTWAHLTGHQSMSGQLEQWLAGPATGPLVVGLWTGLGGGLWWHWLVTK